MAAAGGGVQPLMTFPLLQPCDIAVNYQTVNPTAAAVAQGDKPASQGVVTTSDLVLSLSPAVMQLVMRTAVQLQMTLGQAAPPTVRTQRYVLLHSGCKEHQEDGVETRPTGVSTTGLAFWRPVPVAGYCAVGDLVTSGGAFRPPPRPLRAATLLRDSVALVWPPVAYRRVWCDPAAGLGLWEPIAAEGFIALGCVAGALDVPPPLNLVRCVRQKLLSPSITYSFINNPGTGVRLLQLGNCFQSFLVGRMQGAVSPNKAAAVGALTGVAPMAEASSRMFDLRFPLGLQTEDVDAGTPARSLETSSSEARRKMFHARKSINLNLTLVELAPEDTDKVWTDSDSAGWGPGRLVGGRPGAVWRPMNLPPGYSYFGDVIKASHSERPTMLYAVQDDAQMLARPVDYEVVWFDGGACRNLTRSTGGLCVVWAVGSCRGSIAHTSIGDRCGRRSWVLERRGRSDNAKRPVVPAHHCSSVRGYAQATPWAGTR
jgi:hypothetical protein